MTEDEARSVLPAWMVNDVLSGLAAAESRLPTTPAAVVDDPPTVAIPAHALAVHIARITVPPPPMPIPVGGA